jgi:aspartyl-tRNA(Asn)/glutamyl-tRNA(Gln) amidotransferase subunit A
MASSLDCIGFFTKTPEDMDLLMSITAGQDPKDMTTLPDYYNENFNGDNDTTEDAACPSGTLRAAQAKSSRPVEHIASSAASPIHKIGIIKDFDNDVVDVSIRTALKEKCELLKSKGYEIVELEMPTLKYALAAYYIIQPAEVASNLSRYDGVRYGFRSENSTDLDGLYENTRSEGFMAENKRRIMIGNFVLSSGFYDAYFLKAAKARTLIIDEYNKAFEKCDFILTPVSPNPAFKLGEKVNDPVAMYLEDLMSVSLNLAGVPGLAIPAGETAEGLPIGLQLVGPRRSDKKLIEFSKELI